MILALDIGNTHIVMGCLEDNEIRKVARMATDPLRTEHEYAVMIKQILEIDSIDNRGFDGAIISSVVPPLTSTLKKAIERVTGRKPMVLGAGLKTGLNIMLDNPAQLGSDLVAAGVAAQADYKLPVIIIDMGTATTITVINENSAFLGGAIIPGTALSMNALASGTSQLPKVSIEAPKHCIGTNTIDCMKSGAVFGAASMLDGMIERIEAELGCEASVVATGGLARSITPYCKRKIVCDDDLLLRGLGIIYNKNARKR
ncbi:MAG: type III pantothenate kinase [Ruminococcaceae bacterium]|nr:type III pantothenate kinase [Oscillospiraceae bacterium]